MPSFAISKFTVLLEPLWVSAEFLLLSTGPLLYIIGVNLWSQKNNFNSLKRIKVVLKEFVVLTVIRIF